MSFDDHQKLRYLHPTSLVFDVLAHGRQYLVPALFGLWGAAKGDVWLLVLSAIIFVPALLTSVFRYFTLRYCIEDNELIVTQGLIFRNVRTVPVKRIQNIDFVQNPLHRIFQVAEVRVETASGTEPEAVLRVLSMEHMESLREAVFERQATGSTVAQADPGDVSVDNFAITTATVDPHVAGNPYAPLAVAVDPVVPEKTTLVKITLGQLFKAGLASNRGMVMVGVLLGAYFQFDRGNHQRFDWLAQFIPQFQSTIWLVLVGVVAAIGILFLLRLLSVGWFLLRFFGYRLDQKGDDLQISCGLLTKVSATVPRPRIQFISIHRNLVMRYFGLASVRIETAGGAGKSNEDATEAVSKRWFVPVISEDKIPALINVLRPDINWDESSLDFNPVANKTGMRLSRLAVIESVIVGGIGFYFFQPWGWLCGVGLLPLLLWWAFKKSKAMSYARTQDGIVYRSGVFTRKTSMTFFEKIQTLRVDQSPFDRRWKMAKLSVDTAAAGPADHPIHVRYLDEDFAKSELQWLRSRTGESQTAFG